MDNLRYIKNPDVVLREEEDAGGLLFNPDTNQVQVLNTTGLFIWSLCDGTQDLTKIINCIKNTFYEVPEESILNEVEEFVEHMVSNGFIGIVEK